MNIQLTARAFQGEAADRWEAIARRARLYGRPKVVNRLVDFRTAERVGFDAAELIVLDPVPEFHLHFAVPEWMFLRTRFDHHCRMRTEHMAIAMHPVLHYITKRALELGFTYQIIVGRRGSKDVTHARQLIAWEIKNHMKPDISWPELGRALGGRDHTTIIHAIRRIQAMVDAGKLEEPLATKEAPLA